MSEDNSVHSQEQSDQSRERYAEQAHAPREMTKKDKCDNMPFSSIFSEKGKIDDMPPSWSKGKGKIDDMLFTSLFSEKGKGKSNDMPPSWSKGKGKSDDMPTLWIFSEKGKGKSDLWSLTRMYTPEQLAQRSKEYYENMRMLREMIDDPEKGYSKGIHLPFPYLKYRDC